MDRWDPAAAEPGGAWDQLLAKGEDIWAARAPSDFHSPNMDYWPGEFSETWLYAPERSTEGVLRAYKAGAFFADHGHIARNVELRVRTEDLSRPAYPGETIAITKGSDLTVELDLIVPPTDWEGQPNHIDRIELIAITSTSTRIIAEEPFAPGKPFTRQLKNLQDGFVLRARGRRIVDDGPDLMFYTNPIRIVTEDASPFSNAWKAIVREFTWRRLWGVGMLMLVAASLVAWFRHWRENKEDVVEKPERKSRPKQNPPSAEYVSVLSVTPPRHMHFFLAAFAFLCLAAYGSLVPFNFRPMSFDQAWDDFWFHQDWGRIDLGNRSDWGANVLLFVPIAFFGMGLWCVDRKSRLWKAAGMVLVIGFCAASSLMIEFFQSFIHARVPSHDDVYAQAVGTLVGIVCWFGFGQILTNWWRLHTSKGEHQPLLASVLSLYVLGLIAYSLIPLDFVIHPAEIYKKYQAGLIVLVPDWQAGITKDTVWRIVSDGLAFVPIGVWATIIWHDGHRRRTWLRSLLIGGSVVVLIETAQVFLLSRYAETTDLVDWTLGNCLGLGRHLVCSVSAESCSRVSRSKTASDIGLVWSGRLVCGVSGVLFLLASRGRSRSRADPKGLESFF